MQVLVACEYSGRVRDAFLRAGHDAMSCDMLETEVPGPHYQGDIRDVIDLGWDLMIAHPPCTYLASSANGAFNGPNGWTKNGTKRGPWRREEVDKAVDFFQFFVDAPVARKAIENPKGVISSRIRKADQYIQPWQFGHPECKMTGLWLYNLPPLTPTLDVEAEMLLLPARERARIHHAAPGPNRWKERSRTYQGIADAMAAQWGAL